jgi:HEAT repeat protein
VPGIAPRLVALALLAAGPAVLRSAAPPAASHPNLPAALAEAKALRVPALVVLTKPKATAAVDARITRMGQRFAAATVAVTPALTKQYGLNDDTAVLVLSADGEVVEKFAEAVAAEKVVAALKGHVDAARGELLKGLQPESSAKDKKAALAGLAKLGHRAEDLIPLLADADVPTREAAKKALAALPPDEAMDPLLAALKSDDAKLRAAVHPLAVAATGYKMSPLKVWQTGADDERAAAWEKWNDAGRR